MRPDYNKEQHNKIIYLVKEVNKTQIKNLKRLYNNLKVILTLTNQMIRDFIEI